MLKQQARHDEHAPAITRLETTTNPERRRFCSLDPPAELPPRNARIRIHVGEAKCGNEGTQARLVAAAMSMANSSTLPFR